MSDTPPDFARFLAVFALALGSGIAAVVAFVAVVDPYGLYRLVGPAGFNAVKPALSRYHEEIKLARARQVNPDFVILGNSRAEIGFDPKAAGLRAAGGRGYNLAIPGTGIDTSARQLLQLRAAGVTPKTVILGVEFLDFLRSAAPPPAAPAATSAAVPARPAYWQFDALFSLASVNDSIRTLRIQHDEEAATLDVDGFNPLKEFRAYVRDDGYYKIFAQRAQENSRAFRRKSTTALAPGDLNLLHAFLRTAASTDADIRLVIYPYHAQILAMFEAAGLWPLFEDWKRHLVAAIAEAKRNHPGARITLLDFSGFGPYNCERIPAKAEVRAVTKWYWEAGHFKKELGDIVLARVMAEPLPAPQGATFGIKLDAASEQTNAKRIAAERRACAAVYPGLFESARRLMDKAPGGG